MRQTINKRKQPSSGGIVIESSHASKKGSGSTPTPTQTKKSKEKIQSQVKTNCVIALILSLKDYLTLTIVS